MRFASKVDGWLIPLFVIAIAGMLFAFVAVITGDTPLWLRVVVSFVSVFFCAFLFAILKSTFYVVENGELRIFSGPFRWTIAVADIGEITPTRNPLSSPALAGRRLPERPTRWSAMNSTFTPSSRADAWNVTSRAALAFRRAAST